MFEIIQNSTNEAKYLLSAAVLLRQFGELKNEFDKQQVDRKEITFLGSFFRNHFMLGDKNFVKYIFNCLTYNSSESWRNWHRIKVIFSSFSTSNR